MMNQMARTVAVKNPRLYDDLVSSLGSMAPMLLLGVASGGTATAMGLGAQGATWAALASSGGLEAMSEGGAVMRRIREEGGTEADAVKAGLAASIANLPVNMVLNVLGGPATGNLVKRLGIKGFQEGGQEYLQGVISDVATRLGKRPAQLTFDQFLGATLDPNVWLNKDRFYEFAVGAMVDPWLEPQSKTPGGERPTGEPRWRPDWPRPWARPRLIQSWRAGTGRRSNSLFPRCSRKTRPRKHCM